MLAGLFKFKPQPRQPAQIIQTNILIYSSQPGMPCNRVSESPPIATHVGASCRPAQHLRKSPEIKDQSVSKRQNCLLAYQTVWGIPERYRAGRCDMMEKWDQRKRGTKIVIGRDFRDSPSESLRKLCLYGYGTGRSPGVGVASGWLSGEPLPEYLPASFSPSPLVWSFVSESVPTTGTLVTEIQQGPG